MTNVSELMTQGVLTLSPTDTAERAAQWMERFNVTLLPICDGDRLVGVVTDRDITVGAVARGLVPARTQLGHLMSARPPCCYPDQTLEEVLASVGAQTVHLPVIGHDGRLLGMLALSMTR